MKRLGQHFLKNQRALNAIIGALHITAGDTIIEIGPGHGELTEHLLASPAEKIIAIEKDPVLAKILESRIENHALGKKVTIILGDALTELPILNSKCIVRNSKLVGNIPYYITGYLFRIIGELAYKPSRAVFIIQKEVAERLCAVPPRMNRLAASVQIWARPKIIMTLSPDNFDPPPKVNSAIISMDIRKHVLGIRALDTYYRMVNILFRQPRKTIINNLSFSLPTLPKDRLRRALTHIPIAFTARPQHLSVKKIKELSTTAHLSIV